MSGRSRKTISIGPPLGKPVLDTMTYMAMDQKQRSLIKALFKKDNLNKMWQEVPRHIYELICCPVCDYDHSVPCSACGGRDRHPIPMTELYSLGRLIET